MNPVHGSAENPINTVFIGFSTVQTCAELGRNNPLEQFRLAVQPTVAMLTRDAGTPSIRFGRGRRRELREPHDVDAGQPRHPAGLNSESIDLVYADPPFDSNKK